MRVGIAGYGVVGKKLERFFTRSAQIELVIYDKYVERFAGPAARHQLDACDVVFVAVPTPYDAQLGGCDVSNVAEVVDGVSAPICVKSTVPPGTIEQLMRATGKPIAFSPEYVGESAGHPWREIDDCGFAIVAGHDAAMDAVERAYAAAARGLRIVRADLGAAQLVKYMENCFLATKVAFMNQFFDLARIANVDFAELTSLFLLDARIGPSHTEVTAERGFGGKCLPKDLRAIIAWAREHSDAPLLAAVAQYNDDLHAARSTALAGSSPATS